MTHEQQILPHPPWLNESWWPRTLKNLESPWILVRSLNFLELSWKRHIFLSMSLNIHEFVSLLSSKKNIAFSNKKVTSDEKNEWNEMKLIFSIFIFIYACSIYLLDDRLLFIKYCVLFAEVNWCHIQNCLFIWDFDKWVEVGQWVSSRVGRHLFLRSNYVTHSTTSLFRICYFIGPLMPYYS